MLVRVPTTVDHVVFSVRTLGLLLLHGLTSPLYSDSTEANPSDNQASISVPVHYDSEISLSREANLNFYVVDMDNEAKTAVNTFNDIGPEFKFSLKVRYHAHTATRSFEYFTMYTGLPVWGKILPFPLW